MASEATTQQTDDKTAEKNAAFENRHEKELGFKRFAYIQSLYLFVPLITGAIGAAIGFATLGKPLTRMFPKAFGFSGDAESIIKNYKNMTWEKAARAAELSQAGKTKAEIMDALGMKVEEVPTMAKIAGGYLLGTPAAIAGGIAVGYDKWRKDESSRLAADEINRDIANLELFKPSNPEMVAENKRLRAMLAEAPATKITAIQHEDKIAAEPEKKLA